MRSRTESFFDQDGLFRIRISRGLTALIDPEDFEKELAGYCSDGRSFTIRICDYRWSAIPSKGRFYASICAWKFSRGVTVKMHRLIMGATPGTVVDHINREGTDNRKCNLRIVTQQQNSAWHRGGRGTTSKFNGVHFDSHIGKWRAQTSFMKKRHHIGLFDTEIEAARAYDARAKELFGEFACLNF